LALPLTALSTAPLACRSIPVADARWVRSRYGRRAAVGRLVTEGADGRNRRLARGQHDPKIQDSLPIVGQQPVRLLHQQLELGLLAGAEPT